MRKNIACTRRVRVETPPARYKAADNNAKGHRRQKVPTDGAKNKPRLLPESLRARVTRRCALPTLDLVFRSAGTSRVRCLGVFLQTWTEYDYSSDCPFSSCPPVSRALSLSMWVGEHRRQDRARWRTRRRASCKGVRQPVKTEGGWKTVGAGNICHDGGLSPTFDVHRLTESRGMRRKSPKAGSGTRTNGRRRHHHPSQACATTTGFRAAMQWLAEATERHEVRLPGGKHRQLW